MPPQKKGIDKSLWIKKFIKGIVYSKDEIAVSVYYREDLCRSFALNDAGGRVRAAAGKDNNQLYDNKITAINGRSGEGSH